jgi:hypothetical protein
MDLSEGEAIILDVIGIAGCSRVMVRFLLFFIILLCSHNVHS